MEKGHMKIRMNVEGIRNPKTNALLATNRDYVVPESQFWLRRLEQGDCEKVQSQSPVKKTKTRKTTKKADVVAAPPKVENAEPAPDQDAQGEG